MPDPIRKQLIDKALSALNAVTTITTVSESIRHPEELDKNGFPYSFPIDTNEEKTPFTLQQSAGSDMDSTLTMLVTSMVYSRTNATRTARCDLIRKIEKALVGSTAMQAVSGFVWIQPTRVATDQGTIPNFSVWDQEFEIRYIYESDNGG